jgi:hypothetical protein
MSKAAELAKMGEVLTNSQIGGRRNIIINGAMQVAQRGTSASGLGGTNNDYQTVDRFKIIGGTAISGRVTMSQSDSGLSGFKKCLKLDVTTADTSIGASELFGLVTAIEGQDLQQLKKGTSDAEQITVSYYVKGNAAANYTFEISDADNTRHNTQSFSVTSDWTRVVHTFAADTTGALDNDNATSFSLAWWLHAGSNFTSGTFTENTWASRTTANRVDSNDTSIFDSTDRTFEITGVQLEVGSTATPFEHRSFGEELQLCKRYCNVIAPINDEAFTFGHARTTTIAVGTVRLHPVMRANPTITFSDVTDFQIQFGNGATQTTGMGANELSTEGITMQATIGSGLTVGQGMEIREHTSGAKITVDAEL